MRKHNTTSSGAMNQDAGKQDEDARARARLQMDMILHTNGGGGSYVSSQQQPQQLHQQQQHVMQGLDTLYRQYQGGPRAPTGHQRQTHASQHPQQAAQFVGAGTGGAMHHPLYPSPYTTQQHEMAQQQLQSHLAVAAAAMNPYSAAGYGRGLQQQLDPYHSQHLQQYRTQLELPRGYMLSASQASGPYLAAGPHLGYYGHQYPAMLQRVTSVGGESGAQVNASAAPEPAPPPLHASPTPPQQHQQQHHLHQESILSSLLAARSERLAAGIEDAESSHVAEKAEAAAIESLPAASGSSSEAGASGLMSEKRRQGRSNGLLGQLLDAAGSTSRAEKGRSDSITLAAKDPTVSRTTEPSPHLQPSMTSSPHLGPEPAGVGGLGPAAAAALTAATAMHFTGLRGQFTASSHMHHSMGATMPGMTPPLQAGVTMPGGLGASAGPQASSVSSRLPVHVNQPLPPDAAAMSAVQYMGAAPGTVPGTVTGPVGPPMQSTAFSSHDAFEEHMRQQEKKLQKRAANRKSAQLSRKRKKALIEDLKYENQDLQRHEDILEVIPDPVFAFDALSGGVWFASNSASAQFGLSVEDLTSTCFFDLMTEDCSKRLRVLIENASKDISETGSSLLHERMTVRFKKRKAAVLLGELSGRLSRQGDGITAVCSVRPLSLAADDISGKCYYGDASVSELAEETSGDQDSGEDSRSGGTGATSGSTADSSSGVGTGCTSIADEGSSSVPSLSSLEVKSGRGASVGKFGCGKVQGRGNGGGGSGNSSSVTTTSSSGSSSSMAHGLNTMGSAGTSSSAGEVDESGGSGGSIGISPTSNSGSGISGGSGSRSNKGRAEGEDASGSGCASSPSIAEEYNSDSPLSCGSGDGQDEDQDHDQDPEDNAETDNEQPARGEGAGGSESVRAAERRRTPPATSSDNGGNCGGSATENTDSKASAAASAAVDATWYAAASMRTGPTGAAKRRAPDITYSSWSAHSDESPEERQRHGVHPRNEGGGAEEGVGAATASRKRRCWENVGSESVKKAPSATPAASGRAGVENAPGNNGLVERPVGRIEGEEKETLRHVEGRGVEGTGEQTTEPMQEEIGAPAEPLLSKGMDGALDDKHVPEIRR